MTDFNCLPRELQEALKRCDLLAGEEQLEYYYQLYDPATGGFYYSISSRDSEEMTPFAEGTRFSLEALRMGGMVLPEWYKEKVGSWILNHQDESDGFFYEDLWGTETRRWGNRINRDLAYSVDILRSYCGIEPKYKLPQDRIRSGEGAKNVPDFLESEEKMIEYLDSCDWSQKGAYGTGSGLATRRSLITAAGLLPTVRNYIVRKQNPETGLWGDGLGWNNTNAAMKLSGYFTKDFPYPNVEAAVDSVIKLFGGDEPPSTATWIWNPFVMLERALATNEDKAEKMRRLLNEKGAEIVNLAVDCALKLKRSDGGFAGLSSRGSARQQGFLYGHGLNGESDLDGTLIAGPRLRDSIYSVFGLVPSHDYYAKFNDEFWERCKSKPNIVKTLPRPEGEITTNSHPPVNKPV